MKKTVVTLCSAMLLLCATQGAVNAQQPLSPVVPPVIKKAIAEESLENIQEVVKKLNNAGGKAAITNPVVPKVDTSQGTVQYTTVVSPSFDQPVWVESPAISEAANVSSWGFSVLQGSRRIKEVDLPGFENEIFLIIFSLPNGSSQQLEVKGGEKYKFTPPTRQFVVKRKNRNTGKISVGLHYTGSGKTKLGVYPVNN